MISHITVMVTRSYDMKKDIGNLEQMMSYNMANTCTLE